MEDAHKMSARFERLCQPRFVVVFERVKNSRALLITCIIDMSDLQSLMNFTAS